MLAAAHLLAIGAFAPPSRVALPAVVPTRAPLPACASSAEASMRKIVVGYALASAALCTSAMDASRSSCTYRSRGPRPERSLLHYRSRVAYVVFLKSYFPRFLSAIVFSHFSLVSCYRPCGRPAAKQPSIREY